MNAAADIGDDLAVVLAKHIGWTTRNQRIGFIAGILAAGGQARRDTGSVFLAVRIRGGLDAGSQSVDDPLAHTK
jgi:hypothetical protein